jgi:Regulator of chromosome condensation (RCC1) repeat
MIATRAFRNASQPWLTNFARRQKMVVFACLSLIVAVLIGLTQPSAKAQTASIDANKYLVANPAPANPNATTVFTPLGTADSGTVYTYVITVASAPGAVINITDQLPAGFTATGCQVFGATGTCANASGPSFGPLTATGNPGFVTLYITGTFNTSGTVTNTATASSAGVTDTATVTTVVSPPPKLFDLGIDKKASPSSVPNGGTVTYTITLTNYSNTDVDLSGPNGPLASIVDTLTNSSPLEVDADWQYGGCVASPGSSCVTSPTPAQSSVTLGTNGSTSLSGSGALTATSPAVLKVGGTLTITYTVTFNVFEPCAPASPVVINTAFIAPGGTGGNFTDQKLSNNTSSTPITITGIPTVCPPPQVAVSKRLLTPNPLWGQPVKYEITVKNLTSSTLNFGYNDEVHMPSPVTTTFDAAVTNDFCNNGSCIGQHTKTDQLFIGSTPKTVFATTTPLPVVVGPNVSASILYDAIYKADCQVTKVPKNQIINTFRFKGTFQNPKSNVRGSANVMAWLPALPTCQLKVTKQHKDPKFDPKKITAFPRTISYTIAWTNTSKNVSVRLGSLWDVMSTSGNQYATLPTNYTVTCAAVPAGSAIFSPTPGSGGIAIAGAVIAFQGSQAIRLSNVTIKPLGSIRCALVVVVNRPSPLDQKCQATGKPLLVNLALADPDPNYNPNKPPYLSAQVTNELPLCRNVTITKIANPLIVLPNGSVQWTITITNSGPSGPVGGFTVTDDVPANLGPITSIICVPTVRCAAAPTLSGRTITVKPIGLPAGGKVDVVFTTTFPAGTAPYQSYPNTAKAQPESGTPGFYYQVPAPEGTGSVYPAWPLATKQFIPDQIPRFGSSILRFTITNLDFKPGVTQMSFTDLLPSGLTYGAVTNNCGGSAVLNAAAPSLTVTNAQLTPGQDKCTIEIDVTAPACQSYVNVHTDVTAVTNLGTNGLDATLNVNSDCTTIPPSSSTTTTSSSSTTSTTTSTTSTTTSSTSVPNTPVVCSPGVNCIKAISGSGDWVNPPLSATNVPFGYGCVVFFDGHVGCWGSGPLGRTNPGINQPAKLVSGLIDANSIDTTLGHACVVTKSGNVRCWGSNSAGQLGTGGTANSQTPAPAVVLAGGGALSGISKVAVGPESTCAIATSGDLYCWGQPVGGTGTVSVATQVSGVTGATDVSIGVDHACVVVGGGAAKCWGKTTAGALGTGVAAATSATPVAVLASAGTPIASLISIRAGRGYTCAIQGTQSSNSVLCWGSNFVPGFAASAGVTPLEISPVGDVLFPAATGLASVRYLDVSGEATRLGPHTWAHQCAVFTNSGAVRCWGGNSWGQHGNGSVNSVGATSLPVPAIAGAFGDALVTSNNGKTCAIVGAGDASVVGTTNTSGSVKCWGANGGGGLGDTGTSTGLSAVSVQGL